MNTEELLREQEYTRKVQQRLLELIDESVKLSEDHSQTMRMILADAWEELRLRPTSISPMELEQLAVDMDRFTARKAFADDMAARARQVLGAPFFARIDFCEVGESVPERIVIGIYSLSDEDGALLVHDWRAPIAALYYDGRLGEASYESPDGTISGKMSLKRQYRMDKGRLMWYVDTDLTIEDELLLETLGRSSSRHMHQIVSTIQAEQSRAVRAGDHEVAGILGAAGSGKTSVALHRAAYLLYRSRDIPDASALRILSPTTAFGEYISKVLPELGEEAIRSVTLYELVEEVLGKTVEPPSRQQQRLLVEDTELRKASVAYKCSVEFEKRLVSCAEAFCASGPHFEDIVLEGRVFVSAQEMERLYRQAPVSLSTSERLIRVHGQLEKRVSILEERLIPGYEKSFAAQYSGKQLRGMSRVAACRRLRGVRAALDRMLVLKGSTLMEYCMRQAPEVLRTAYAENVEQGLTWWEDAVAEAYLAVMTGCAKPEKQVRQILIDEAQDYSDTALRLIHAWYPNAKATLLGDPMQRTCPGMPACEPERWGACFGRESFPLYRLSRCYRTTAEIARFLNRILPKEQQLISVDRHGDEPVIAPYSEKLVSDTLDCYRAAGYRSIAVITRTQEQANGLASVLKDVYRLDGGHDDLSYEAKDNVVSSVQLVKGMEFDAAIVVWQDVPLIDDERRRLYTACSRALHALTLVGAPELPEVEDGK